MAWMGDRERNHSLSPVSTQTEGTSRRVSGLRDSALPALSIFKAVANPRRRTGTRKPSKCARYLGVRRLDAAFLLRSIRDSSFAERGSCGTALLGLLVGMDLETARRRQAAALQGAFGTAILMAALTDSGGTRD